MKPKYSILLCNQEWDSFETEVEQWLASGVKVFWFSVDSHENDSLKERFHSFYKAYLFHVYTVTIKQSVVIVDGKDENSFIEKILSKDCPLFNSAQYLVEHCKSTEHITVQASAGTGKTTVMIDRIMYLLHMVPNLNMSEIYMITFTNAAADQMNRRLQDSLMLRYRLTRQKKYLRWVEEQSQMNISTIHSFAYLMLKEYGIGESFTKNLAIRSFQYEKKELIKDVLDTKVDEKQTIKAQLGIPFYRANTTINDFWSGFSRLGISHDDIGNMDWGEPDNKESQAFQTVTEKIVKELDDGYFDIKRENDAIGIEDIMRDLQFVLTSNELPQTDISIKYLFIDEFQDSDLSQIEVACRLVQLFHAYLFVVGDIKQSIYRFRGATDQAFSVLNKKFIEMKIRKAREFVLVNNYRTAAGVMRRMDQYFRVWGHMGVLQYDKSVIPLNNAEGSIRMISCESVKEDETMLANLVSQELDSLVERVNVNNIDVNEKTRVVLLTRTNTELNRLAMTLRKHKIPASIKRDGSFFASEAVRDFYIMISSFLFCDEPKHVFNYLLTPYAGEIDSMNINDMEWLHGDYDNLVLYLDRYLNQTSWKKYHKDFRLKPVLSVIKEMFDEVSVIDNFIMNSKARKKSDGWDEARCNAATFTEARQYQANLEKLLEMLQRNLSGEKVSLYDVYRYLQFNISTNRTEGEASVESKDDYTSVLCMTVHKSKGLEFDTVILPYMNRVYPIWPQTEVLIDPIEKKVGWIYTGEREKKYKQRKKIPMQNDYYDDLKELEIDATIKEETRILYVAMTRAINKLICVVPRAKDEKTWAYLIEGVGVDYE